MKTYYRKPKIHITTLGCSKNLYDSEILIGQLKANNIMLTEEPSEADLLIVNTCGFITPAKEESIEAILEAGQIKKNHPGTKVLVCGCLSERYKSKLQKNIPEVDVYFGTEDFKEIMTYLNLPQKPFDRLYEDRYLSQTKHYAYLKISEGCNHKCAFCAIPQIRGRYKSRSIESIVDEVRILASQGVVELILIAQDTTFYGLDRYKKQKLVALLHKLESIAGLNWIRIHYAYPTTFQHELIEFMANSKKLVPYIDLPIQHISDKVLRTMKRGGTSQKIKNILLNVRERIPQVALRSTLIVGHPGETEKEYNLLKNFVQEFQFDRLGVFKYSPEENTAAFKLPAPSAVTIEQRFSEIMEIQQKISFNKNRKIIGKILEVLVDEIIKDSKTAIGRTFADSPEIDNEVIIENISNSVKPGRFYSVKINDSSEYELFGEILEEK